ncbi:hypothetical protein NUW54_g13756 [Trametes sanguinea]|uniref:Uncharacterized protein n=1 Tax=Trametes sanguinea TaxID=158606 RepID=A0ACC1MJU4_9APHY|nr:hypothetical protein NUW54_g13756 [Trametes sanguinea]
MLTKKNKYGLHSVLLESRTDLNCRTHRSSQSVSTSRHREARDFADADLQRAIQLSLEEVGAAGGHRPGYVPSPSSWHASATRIPGRIDARP